MPIQLFTVALQTLFDRTCSFWPFAVGKSGRLTLGICQISMDEYSPSILSPLACEGIRKCCFDVSRIEGFNALNYTE